MIPDGLCYTCRVRARVLGMTLVEVVLAIAILAVAGLGLIAALTRAMSAQSYSAHQTMGRLIAESVLQEEALKEPTEWGTPATPVTGTNQARVGQRGELVDYNWESWAVQIRRPPSPGPAMGEVWEVHIKLWWSETPGDGGGPERGTQTLEMSRMVYVQT